MRWAIWTCLFLATAAAAASGDAVGMPDAPDAEVIRQEPLLIGELGSPVESDDPYVTAAFQARPNLRGIAAAPTMVTLRAPSGRMFTFRLRRFDGSEGISLAEDGEIVVDSDPSRLSYYWYGGDGHASISIGVSRGVMHSTITGPLDRLSLVRDRDGSDILQSLDVNSLNRVRCLSGERGTHPTPLAPAKHVVTATAERPPILSPRHYDEARPKYAVEVGVVFLYTPAALAAVSSIGDPLALIPRADAAIAELQTALENAGQSIHIRVRRVGPITNEPSPRIGLVPVAYDESPAQLDAGFRYQAHRFFLNANWNNDENMPPPPAADDGINIVNSREDFGGDLLVMLVADQGQPNGTGGFAGPFGIAMTQRRNCDFNGALTTNRDCDIGPAYKDFAFAVLSVLRLTDNFTFAHEAGHTLGSEHDRGGVAGTDYQEWTTTPAPNDVIASFASSYGFRTPGSGGPVARMDVMGSPFCLPATSTTNCWTRDLQFADPGRTFVTGSTSAGQTTPSNPNQGYGFNSRSFRQLIEDIGSFYGPTAVRPLFWDGFE